MFTQQYDQLRRAWVFVAECHGDRESVPIGAAVLEDGATLTVSDAFVPRWLPAA